jgi:type II secretory ATPase GspE/PulE/Tfp pilus assembly ATPase PilB-like protein
VRRICSTCKISTSFTDKKFKIKYPGLSTHFSGKEITLYSGKGCAVCSDTGFQGRSAIYEIIRMTPELKNLILKHPSTEEVWHIASSQGSKSMFEDGVEKVKSGVTTIEELLRVAIPPITPGVKK